MEQYIIYIIQLVAIVFAVCVAFRDAISVNEFERIGTSNDTMARFHRSNVWLKTIVCFGLSMAGNGWLQMIEYGLLSAGWIYLVFDIALNTKRPGRRWDYIGSNDADGRFWIRLFNGSAGKWKAVILSVLIVAGNVLIIIL